MIRELKKYIELTGLKKKKIAEMLDISPEYLSYIINGKKMPSRELELKIRNLYK